MARSLLLLCVRTRCRQMPTWNEIDVSIKEKIADGGAVGDVCDAVRQSLLKELSGYVCRPVIAYYSGFLQKAPHPELAITDFDMNGFMAVVHNLDKKGGLDLVLHTPGGGTEATRALVEYLYSMFGKDIRVIVPQMAMSAGTMIACASRQIIMGKHSTLGPTDPQVNGVAAIGVIEEIETALKEIGKEPLRQIVWQEVFRKYPPVFISNCNRSISGTKEMVKNWLMGNMLSKRPDPEDAAKRIVGHLMNFRDTTEHAHHFLKGACKEIGLEVLDLEADQELQERVLSVHHAYVASFARVRSIKFIENSVGSSWNVSA